MIIHLIEFFGVRVRGIGVEVCEGRGVSVRTVFVADVHETKIKVTSKTVTMFLISIDCLCFAWNCPTTDIRKISVCIAISLFYAQ